MMLDDEALEENDWCSLAADCQQVESVPASAEYISLIWQLMCRYVLANAHKWMTNFMCVCIDSMWFVSVSSEASLHWLCVLLEHLQSHGINRRKQLAKCHLAGKVRGREWDTLHRNDGRDMEAWEKVIKLDEKRCETLEERGKKG